MRNRKYDPKKFWDDRRKFGLDTHSFIDSEEEDVIDKIIKDLNCKRILEIGCGNENLSHLPNYLGIDFSLIALKGQKNVMCADVCHLPFRKESFDMIISRAVLMHIPNIQKAMKEITRVTRKAIALKESHPSPSVKLAKHCFSHDFQQLLRKEWKLRNELPYEVFVK